MIKTYNEVKREIENDTSRFANKNISLGKVKNNTQGRMTIEKVKRFYSKKGWSILLKGRHSDRKKLFAQLGKRWRAGGENDVPVKYAEEIAIYLIRKETKKPIIIRNPDSDEFHAVWRKVQNRLGITTGDVEPSFAIELDNKIRNGMTPEELERIVVNYYATMRPEPTPQPQPQPQNNEPKNWVVVFEGDVRVNIITSETNRNKIMMLARDKLSAESRYNFEMRRLSNGRIIKMYQVI